MYMNCVHDNSRNVTPPAGKISVASTLARLQHCKTLQVEVAASPSPTQWGSICYLKLKQSPEKA